MDKKTARRIQRAARPYMETDYTHVNIFVTPTSIDIEPVSSALGCGTPASPGLYDWYETNVPVGWLEDTETILERLD